MERPRHIPCPDNGREGCKYFGTPQGCHESIHHVYPQRTAETPVQRRFGNLAINKIISCRNIHDLLDTFPPPEYPTPEAMRRKIDNES